MPALADLFNGVTTEDFKDFWWIKTEISVTDSESGDSLVCGTTKNCEVEYNWNYTPRLHSLQPPIVYKGVTVSALLDSRATNDYSGGSGPAIDMRIDGTAVDYGDHLLGKDEIRPHYKQFVQATVMTEERNMDATFTAKFRGAGNQYNETADLAIYNLEGTSSYQLKVYPSIYGISHASGYENGGQILTITGSSLDGDNVSVLVDGVECVPKTIEKEKLTCVTGKKETSAAEEPTYYVGQQGLKRYYFFDTDAVKIDNWQNYVGTGEEDARQLWTAPEIGGEELFHWSTNAFTSYFRAPADGQYRFYMACDDNCYLDMSLEDPMNPAAKERILDRPDWTTFRNMWPLHRGEDSSDFGKIFSKWITMTQGQHYYFESAMKNYGGPGHLTIALEYKPEVPYTSHPLAETQVQRFSISQTDILMDTVKFIVYNPDAGTFIIMFLHPTNGSWVESNVITAGTDADSFKDAIKSFYTGNYKVEPIVTLTFFNSDGAETTENAEDATVYVYTVQLPIAIEGQAVTNIQVVAQTTTSTVQFVPSSEIQQSSPPLSGSYWIRCYDTDGQWYSTQNIPADADFNFVRHRIVDDCPFLKNKVVVDHITSSIPTRAMGTEVQIHFFGMDGAVNNFEMVSSFADPVVGANVVYSSETTRPYGESIIFPVVPPEYFFTNEEGPQVMVQVDDFPVLCGNLECGYSYVEQSSLITAFIVSGQDVTITGTGLPLEITSVTLARIECIVNAHSETEIMCTLAETLPAGSWMPIVRDELGAVEVDAGVAMLNISIVITEISPSTNLNQAGGDILTITGENFPPSSKNGADLSLSLMLNDNTRCVPITITSTQITCETEALLKSRRRLQDVLPSTFGMTFTLVTDSYDLTVEYDGFTANPNPLSTVAIFPEKVSPIARRTIEIQLDENYPTEGMTTEDFSVILVPASLEFTYLTINNEGIRPLNVIAVDTTAKKITVKYGGAYSGLYGLVIKSVTNGNIDTNATQLQVVFEINSFEPQTGSIFGGSAITIYGGPFSDDIEDTIVKVGFEWWDNINNYCYVFESTEEYVRCRLPLDLNREAKSYGVIAFARTYEESNCNFGDCQFTFIAASDLPEVTSFSTAFDTASGKYQITISGTGFTDTVDQIDFMLSENSQNVLSVSPTEVVVEVEGFESGLNSNKIDLYFSVGIPNGYTVLLNGVTFAPKLVSLSTNTVSSAGSMIQATIEGAGVNDSLTLVDSASQTDLCLTAMMTEYSVLECELDPSFDFSSGAPRLSVKETVSGTVHACAASDATSCDITLISEQPAFSAVEKVSSSQMRITGSVFPTSGFDCSVKYGDAVSDTCMINSSVEVVADFTFGIAIQQTEVSPVLSFIADSETFAHHAVAGDLAVLANPFSLSSVTTGLSSSFAGGRALTVAADGLSQTIAQKNAELRVCQKACLMQVDASDADQLTCTVPAIATKRSNELFEIRLEGDMYGAKSIFGGLTEEDVKTVYDQKSLPAITNTATECFVGIEFASGYIGVLKEINIFLDYFNPDNIENKLHIQASSDNFASDIVTLHVIGEDAHEGWNYYPMEDTVYYDDNGEVPGFSYFRLFSSASQNGCDAIGEIRWIGQEVINDSADTYNCEVELVSWSVDANNGDLIETVTDLGVTVGYETSSTPRLTDIWPMYGAVEGNEEITFTGENFPELASADYSILIDERECSVISVTSTEVKCMTAPRIGAWEEDPKLEFSIAGYGNVATQGLVFRYCSAWSQESTWGYLFLPVDGESVAVPKGLCLLVDIDNSPRLRLVSVDGGTIIFPPSEDHNHHRTFDAQYIIINKGAMIVGTEDHPYTSKLTITMHGTKNDPAMPIYGKKSIGVRYGTLDMHGVTKKSWTDLDSTISPGDSSLTLVELVDWEAGDLIMVTATGYNQWEAEFKTIVSVDNSSGTNSVITVDSGYDFTHVAGVENLGDQGDTLTIRAEVALMSHNVVFRGDPETSAANKFGAHIMIASPGNESSIGRIENVQFNDVGQAFLMGKYPIHFHMLGRVTKSYIRNNSIHRSYNRGTTLHGVHYLRVSRNTYFDVMGHVIFVEDAAETKNLIEYNVVAGVKPSHSILNTDQSPACFWITHPDNIFVGNRAAGSSNYGFWMDYQETAIGPSFNVNIKPISAKLGLFRNNIAHSVGNYGLRIFHGHTPPTRAVYEDYLSYSCNKNGIMSGEMGLITFKNITVASNRQYGFEMERIIDGEIDENNVIDAVVVGSSQLLGGSTAVGMVGPQSSKWYVKNARFYHFTNGSAGIGTCSNCEAPKGDSGARTYRFEQLYWDDATVTKRVHWLVPEKGILHDLDGTLTEQGPDSYVTAYWKHNDWPECTVDLEKFSGIVCPHPWSVKRIVFYAPDGNLNRQHLFLWRYDQDVLDSMTEYELSRYLIVDNASSVFFKEKENPMYHWTVPYVTGHKYYARWAHGLDFNSLKVQIEPQLWDNEDQDVYFVLPHYETRGRVEFETDNGIQYNNTLSTVAEEDWVFGTNTVYNDTETREIHFIVNGRDGSEVLKMTGLSCVENCGYVEPEEPEEEEVDDNVKLWSDPASWPDLDNRIPVEGEEVVITSSMNITYDIGDSPLFKSVMINGNLTFLYGQPAVLNTYSVWVRAGTLNIGSESEPFDSTVEIKLHGNITSPSEFVFSPQIQAGNKNFIITGHVNMFGKKRNGSARLLQSAFSGEDTLVLPTDLDWKAGDYLALPATNMDPRNSETVQLLSYSPDTGAAQLQQSMTGYHFGAQTSTAEAYSGIDMRAEVMLLSRDINITASTDEASRTSAHPDPWGCRVLVSDFFETDLTYNSGSLNMDNVSIFNCSQTATLNAALKFDGAVGGDKVFTNGVISSGAAQGVHIENSQKVTISDTVIHDFVLWGLKAPGSSDFTLENNILNQIRPNATALADQEPLYWPIPNGGYNMIGASSYTFKNNTAASMWHTGFQLPSKPCGTSNNIIGNIAHSISGIGALVIEDSGECSEFSDFMGYKNALPTVQLSIEGKNIARNIISIDSAYGVHAGGTEQNSVEVRDCILYGSKNMQNIDCPPGASSCFCPDRKGVLNPTFGGSPKEMKNELSIAKMFKGGGGWGGESLFIDNTFIGFDSYDVACGGHQSAIGTNGKHSNYHPVAHFTRNKFIDQAEDAMFGFISPSEDWINLADCGTFTCTGLYNVVFKVSESAFEGTPLVSGLPNVFQVISNNLESVSSQVVPSCQEKSSWNAYMCQEDNLGILLFESQDDDRMDRSQQPLFIIDEDRGFSNRLNAFQDVSWDGAYTGQKREQRFPTMVDSSRNYTIEYTGTPAKKQKFTYFNDPGTSGFMITIQYPDAGAYVIYNENGEQVDPTSWDYEMDQWQKPTGSHCGENRFLGIDNILQFWIEPGCTLYVMPRDAIMLGIRLDWDVQSFYDSTTVESFTDKMAASLGIASADLKIVQIYEGSVIVNFQILAEMDDPEPSTTLQVVQETFVEIAADLDTEIGAPVLGVQTSEVEQDCWNRYKKLDGCWQKTIKKGKRRPNANADTNAHDQYEEFDGGNNPAGGGANGNSEKGKKRGRRTSAVMPDQVDSGKVTTTESTQVTSRDPSSNGVQIAIAIAVVIICAISLLAYQVRNRSAAAVKETTPVLELPVDASSESVKTEKVLMREEAQEI